MDDLEWENKEYFSTDEHFGSLLFIPQVGNNNSIASFDAIPIDHDSTDNFMTLCNGAS